MEKENFYCKTFGELIIKTFSILFTSIFIRLAFVYGTLAAISTFLSQMLEYNGDILITFLSMVFIWIIVIGLAIMWPIVSNSRLKNMEFNMPQEELAPIGPWIKLMIISVKYFILPIILGVIWIVMAVYWAMELFGEINQNHWVLLLGSGCLLIAISWVWTMIMKIKLLFLTAAYVREWWSISETFKINFQATDNKKRKIFFNYIGFWLIVGIIYTVIISAISLINFAEYDIVVSIWSGILSWFIAISSYIFTYLLYVRYKETDESGQATEGSEQE